jgi:hypothetical protein
MKDATTYRPNVVARPDGFPFLPLLALALFLAGFPMPGHAEQAQPGVLKFTPKMPASALASRSDADLVELTDGRQVRMGDVRRLKEAARKMRAKNGAPLPAGLMAKPAATGTPLKNASDLAAALKRPDTDTVVLPSGRKVTVGMIRLLQPQVEKRTGRSLASGAKRQDLSGSAVKVGEKTDWKDVLQRPDGTVLEAPDGTRITVGELKKSLGGGRP